MGPQNWSDMKVRFVAHYHMTTNNTHIDVYNTILTYQVERTWKRDSYEVANILAQGRRSRSGRPGDCRTNVLTGIASPSLGLQARNPHTICTDPCPHKRHGQLDIKESCWDLRTSRFWAQWPQFVGQVSRNTLRLADRLAYVAPSRSSQGGWNCRWTPRSICMRADVKWIRILLSCQD